MKAPRLNIFNQIHKGLRALLFDTATLMQQTDLGDSKLAEPVLEQTQLLLALFDAHAQHEDACILDKAAHHAPDLVREFKAEHQTTRLLARRLRELINSYRAASSYEQRQVIGYSLLYALHDFISFNLKHMNKEEQDLNAVLWHYYPDEAIHLMEQKIQAMIPADQLLTYFKWMIKGSNEVELVQWLLLVKNTAHAFVLNGLLQECSVNLPPERWEIIQTALAEGVVT